MNLLPILTLFVISGQSLSLVTLQPSAWLLTSSSKSIILNCASNSKTNRFTTFIFRLGSREIYNSKTNYKAIGVTVRNASLIEYTRITDGLDRLTCLMNSTKSTAITIPYLKGIQEPKPAASYLGVTFPIQCNADLKPSSSAVKYQINFLRDNDIVGRWTVDGIWSPSWSTPTRRSELIVAKGTGNRPQFSALMTPKNSRANGKFYCQLVYLAPDKKSYTVNSNVWRISFAPAPVTTKKPTTTPRPKTTVTVPRTTVTVPRTTETPPKTTVTRSSETTPTQTVAPTTITTRRPLITTTTQSPKTTPTVPRTTGTRPKTTPTTASPPRTTQFPVSASFSVQPAKLSLTSSNTFSCIVHIPPSIRASHHLIKFYYTDQCIGFYGVQADGFISWTNAGSHYFSNFFIFQRGPVAGYPNYTAILSAKNADASGSYYCSVLFRNLNNEEVEVRSNIWSANSSGVRAGASIWTIVVIITITFQSFWVFK